MREKIIMKIAIEALPTLGEKVGLGYYVKNLIKSLAAVDKTNQYVLFGSFWKNYKKNPPLLYCPKQDNFTLETAKFPNFILANLEEKLKLPIQYWMLRRHNIDLFHGTGNLLPPMPEKKIKTVVTICDLSFVVNPKWYNSDWHKGVKSSAERADKIIAISESTKEDLVKYYRINKEKIRVIPLAADPNYRIRKDRETLDFVRTKYNLPDKFILFVGGIRPIKNLPRIMTAFALLRKNEKIKEKLVIVGKTVHPSKEVFEALKALHLENEVVFTGYVPIEDLVYIYNLAEVFIFATLYEGFGIPILEAMACGTPVITSNISSMPEVAGNAALLVDPYDASDIALGVSRVLSDKSLRQELINKGLERIKVFSWEKTAEKTLEVYHECLK